MTDSEIIKALECCKNLNCSACPKKTNIFVTDCDVKLCEEAIDLINRQQAEIERLEKIRIEQLKAENKAFADLGKLYSEIKSEAIRKFAEKLKSKSEGIYPWYFVVDVDEIDSLLKEMESEDNA